MTYYNERMRTALTIFGSVLLLLSSIPYVVEVVRRKAKPRIVSWFTWTLLLFVSIAATAADRDWQTVLLLCGDAIGTAAVVVVGWKYGDRKFERLDVVCQIAVLAGLLLWFVFNSPLIALLASVAIDFVGAVPSIKHSWQKPHEETAITYAMDSIGSLATLVALESFRATAIIYPIYLVAINGAFAVIVVGRKKYAAVNAPAELRQL